VSPIPPFPCPTPAALPSAARGTRPREAERELIVTGDDFGLSTGINHAIIRAHRQGILTSASLMVNEPGFAEAVNLARQTPTLAVGLHLALSGGASTLPPERIPSLVGQGGQFRRSPARAGLKYFFSPGARRELEGEIRAQIERFLATGLDLGHVDGHHHLHMHPVVFPVLVRVSRDYRIGAVRVVRESLALGLSLDPGRFFSGTALYTAFSLLARRSARGLSLRTADHVLGLLHDGRMTQARLLALLAALPPGTTEIYSHPSLGGEEEGGESRVREYEALVSPEVASAVERLGIRLTRYRDAARRTSPDGSPGS
jgi:hopanoid biosynthesis associated protein HpnK